MNVVKRNGSEEVFDIQKIITAISKANAEGNGYELSEENICSIANYIKIACERLTHTPSVEDIQDMVEDQIMSHGKFNLARRYIKYRYNRYLVRKSNSTDDQILSLIECNNEVIKQENSNKNPVINSVQRDYMAGEVSRDLTKRFLLPKHIVKAHEEGIIHFHDSDYFAQHMHNCFSSKTRFVTDTGVLAFEKCKDGEEVNVLDKDGCWRKAVVHKYEPQKLYDVTLKSCRTFKTITCTRDHRWILKDGKVTTNLVVGDILYPLTDTVPDTLPQTKRECEMFALGMIIGDGCDKPSSSGMGVQIRLCGDKIKYADVFRKCGYTLNAINGSGDIIAYSTRWTKQQFLDVEGWKYLNSVDKRMLFLGYYAADGCKDQNMCHTSDIRVAAMIEEISAICGYHIVNKKHSTHDTPYKKDADLYQFSFIRQQPTNRCWKVEKIEEHRSGNLLQDTWCVEEPVTHSFTLDGGVVTGNCCLVNLEDMLQNGTVISETMIEKPHSFSTACNIATQCIAQVASSQYGGQSITLSHLAPFVDVSRKKFKKQVQKECESIGLDLIEEKVEQITEMRVREEIKRGVQMIQYQVITLMTTNGQAPFVTVFMYLNEVPAGQTRDDLAIIIEEMLRQRIQGVKNEKGVYITPAFPKLIYVLEEDNIREGAPYFYLTELAAQCTAKRMVPDYISEKKMIELKIDKNGEGHCYPCINKICA